MRSKAIETLLVRLDHDFADPSKLEAALTHSSSRADYNYERLEFLGDRVLGLVMAHLLFETFPDESEGDLAKRHAVLVQGSIIAEVAKSINLGASMILSDAERATGGDKNDNILADVMEAVLGAIYLDAGMDVSERIIKDLWGERVLVMTEPPQDPKTELQEWAQKRGLPLPLYSVVGREGPDHAPVFKIEVMVEGYAPKIAEGLSRRSAEKSAADDLLEYLKEKNPG